MPEESLTTDQTLAAIQNTTLNGLGTALRLAGVAAAPILAATFVTETVFRLVRFVQAVKEKKRQIEDALDRKVRARDILREPIYDTLEDIAIQEFFKRGGFAARNFPEIYLPLRKEAEEWADSSAASETTKLALRFAFRVLVPVYRTGRQFTSPPLSSETASLLNISFGQLLDPEDGLTFQFGRVARDAALLFPDEEYARGFGSEFQNQVLTRTSSYFQAKLDTEIKVLAIIKQSAQQEMEKAFKDLVVKAITGDAGFAKQATDFATKLRVQLLKDEIAELTTQITNTPEGPVKEALKARKADREALLRQIPGA